VIRAISAAALACLLAAAPSSAQDAAAPVQPAGGTAASLEVGGGYVVGLWRQASPRMRAGIEVGTTLSRAEDNGTEEAFTSFAVRPTVRLFSGAEGAVRPYTLVGAYAEGYRRRSASEEFDAEQVYGTTEVGARIGAGVEWLPVSRLAVGGHVGVRGGYLRDTIRTASGAADRELDGWSAGTFTSGLALTLFF
jgi:hypothetical protein